MLVWGIQVRYSGGYMPGVGYSGEVFRCMHGVGYSGEVLRWMYGVGYSGECMVWGIQVDVFC